MSSTGALPERIIHAGTHERILWRTGRIVEHSRQLAALNAIASSVNQSLDLEDRLNDAIQEVLELMELEFGLIYLTFKSSDDLTLCAQHGADEVLAALIEHLQPEAELIAPVLETGGPLFGEIRVDRGKLGRHLRRKGLRFFVAIPLKAKGRTLGVMVLANQEQREVDSDCNRFLGSVGNLIGAAIENAFLHRDITRLLGETKLQAEQLKVSERQFRAVIESATDAVAIVQEGRFMYLNPYGFELLGYSAPEVCNLGFLDCVHPYDWDRVAQLQRKRLQGEAVPPFDITLVRKDGTELPVSVNMCCIEHERQPALLIIARDITEPRLLREQVLQSEKMAAMGQLISGVAHELNNPLTAVMGYSELMQREPDLPDTLHRDLEVIHDAAKRAAGIVQNLLTFARQNKGGRSRADINDLIERTLALRAYEQKVNNIQVIKLLNADLPPIVVDSCQIQQVLLNLIVNAEQAMLQARGHGQLVIQTVKKPAGESAASGGEGQTVEIVVSDNGPGIPVAHMNRIFEPFFTTKPVGQGTGLGLSISHSLVQSHGGRLYVKSQPGSGSTFIIELPVVEQSDPAPVDAPSPAPPPAVSDKRVLIIDDEPAIVRLLQRIVTAEGHGVDTAANGNEALLMLDRQSYHLIFCDMRMPGLSGGELYQELKRRNRALTGKMVFVTGDLINGETRRFLDQSGARFIKKPFASRDVVQTLRAMLSDRNADEVQEESCLASSAVQLVGVP